MDHIKKLEEDNRKLKEQIFDICYFMNGGIELATAWNMSFEDREIAVGVINKRLKEKNPNAPEYM